MAYLVALSLAGLVDAISYMVVAPSIIFYVLELGGNKEQYGIILSAFSFASFCAKPFLGGASDRFGFKIPYIFSLSLAALGGLLYVLASLGSKSKISIGMVLVSRLLGGVGAASSALGYAYLARVVPNKDQTKTSSLLSMMRIVGMSAGPGVNIFLAGINGELMGFQLDPLNAVGLVLFGSNVLAMLSIVFLLDEPPEETSSLHKKKSSHFSDDGLEEEVGLKAWCKSCLCAEIAVPILSTFALNANFQLIETGFAPVASHVLGWGPVQTSTVLGSTSILIFFTMILVYQLSARKVSDERLLFFGLSLSTFGYTLMYFLWNADAPAWHLIIPIVLGVCSFPFLGAPTRSVFTKMVDTKPLLDNHRGTMQAVLSMSASVAGFVTPGFVAAFVLRHPEQVEASAHHREMTPLALFAPAMSVLTLIGLAYMQWKLSRRPHVIESDDADVEESMADERTRLMQVSAANTSTRRFSSERPRQRLSCHQEAHRRQSAILMGFPQQSMLDELDAHENEVTD